MMLFFLHSDDKFEVVLQSKRLLEKAAVPHLIFRIRTLEFVKQSFELNLLRKQPLGHIFKSDLFVEVPLKV